MESLVPVARSKQYFASAPRIFLAWQQYDGASLEFSPILMDTRLESILTTFLGLGANPISMGYVRLE